MQPHRNFWKFLWNFPTLIRKLLAPIQKVLLKFPVPSDVLQTSSDAFRLSSDTNLKLRAHTQPLRISPTPCAWSQQSHTFGIYFRLLAPIATLSSVSIYPPTSFLDPLATPVVPNSQNILDSVLKMKSNILPVVPAFLEQWAFSLSAVNVLKTLEYVIYGGSPLAPKIGNSLVNAGVKLSCGYDTTEFGVNFWDWVRFRLNSKIRWAPQDDGTYECQILYLLDVKGYATSDIFIKRLTIEGLWKIIGRVDDVLILSSGEKTVPAPMESIICANSYVAGAIVFGHGCNQVGILKQLAEFRNQVWPNIEEPNKEAPAFSRIFKEMILVTHSQKPMLRTGKGTIIKKATVKLYEEEINALYETVKGSTRAGINTAEDVEGWLKVHAAAVNADKEVDPDADLFTQGFDSISATFLKNHIIGSLSSSDCNLQASALWIDQNIIFSSPLIPQLTKSIINAVLQRNGTTTVDAKANIENMIERYSVGLGNSVTEVDTTLVNGCSQSNCVVVLTGSMGGLGSYLLADLLQSEDVSVVYAFNCLSKDCSLDFTMLQSNKLVYVETDTSDDHLGLDQELYQKVYLALSSPHQPKPCFMFTSSIASAQSWDKMKGSFPEEVEYNPGVASQATSGGMDSTNTVSIKVLVNSKLPASSFRIGQISGGPCEELGTLPEAKGFVSWIPPHAISNAVLDVAFAEEEPPIVVNLVHPRPTTWKTLMQPIMDALVECKVTSYLLPLMPFSEWLEKLKSSAKDLSEGSSYLGSLPTDSF
ncbi:hypothetical protein BDR06DRAFT_1037076 [Suillus hirtellus]|nr:hypothetical protein BDR06DRAFT_1037076 [Suillus hirtellus]